MQSFEDYTSLANSMDFRTKCWIDGQFVSAKSGETFENINPATGKKLCDVARGNSNDIDAAVNAARAAFQVGRWSGKTPSERKEVILNLARLIRENITEMALLDTLDMGKPISETVNVDAPGSAFFFQWHAEATDKIYDEIAPTGGRDIAMIRRVPLGVICLLYKYRSPRDGVLRGMRSYG